MANTENRTILEAIVEPTFGITQPFFHSEAAARDELESIFWPTGPVCPRCGRRDRITDVRGPSARSGLRRCLGCKRQFTVTVGTPLDASHVPLHRWLLAALILASARWIGYGDDIGMELHRSLGVTHKTALKMVGRLRELLRDPDFAAWPLLPKERERPALNTDRAAQGRSFRQQYLSPDEVSRRYDGKISVTRLASWRSQRYGMWRNDQGDDIGPGFIKIPDLGIRYSIDDIEEWEQTEYFDRIMRHRANQKP